MLRYGYFDDSNKSSSPTTDFAFQPPQEYKVPPSESVPTTVPYPLTIPSHGQFNTFNTVSSATGPFTMTGGTVTPTVDLPSDTSNNSLPRISRDFVPPSAVDARRPATTAGTLNRRDDDNTNGFQNPFTTSPTEMVPSQSASVDPHYQAETPSWHSSSQQSLSYPATAVGVSQGYYSSNSLLNPATRTASVTRPQTSDGLPSYPSHLNGVTLPSTRSLVSQIGGYSSGVSVSPTYSVSGQMVSGYPNGRYGSYDQNSGRYVSGDSDLQFVPLPGPIPNRKRSRRRYDEIERIYHCEWKGCDKAYGTLNHLNAHVAMQKHGEKRLPAQFKDMRKEWRRKKREEATEAANKELQAQAAAAQQAAAQQAAAQHAAAAAAAAGVDPSGYQWGDARHSTADPSSLYSNYSASSTTSLGVDSDPYGHRGSTTNTVSSGGSPTDGRFTYNSSGSWSNVYDRKNSLSVSTPQSATAPSSTFTPYTMNHHSIVYPSS